MTSLPPLVFELHTDQRGGSAGLIQRRGDSNPTLDALRGGYGAPFDPSKYKAPGMGVSLLELSATPDNVTDQTVNDAASKLYDTLMSVDNVRTGKRGLHFFAGHGDVTTGQTGAPGEKAYVKRVQDRLAELAKGNPNFKFYESILDPNDTSRTSGDESTTNWGRGQQIIQNWKPGDVTPPITTPDSEDPTPGVNIDEDPDPVETDISSRSEAIERAKQYKNVALSADDVVDGYGNNFGSMKSQRLGEALRGAQVGIIQDRINRGESFGTKRVEVTPPTPDEEEE